MNDTLEAAEPVRENEATQTNSQFRWIGWSSLFIAMVQSVCTMFVALSGMRLLLGAAAFASALGAMQILDKIHTDAIRLPMVLFALAGAMFNLAALWQVRRLRRRAASAWRQKSVSSSKFASEKVQLALSLLTLGLLLVESYFHFQKTHHF
ncbi:MAG TPA: hypothetical protein VL128_11140 [Candidatus Eisenbacteria bacterium]|nr:hypothetical protein [Candidatus Eisenbacteria bacterium]